MRLIDADKIGLTDFEILMCDGSYKGALEALISKVERQPTVDSVPVVRCKDCKWSDEEGRCEVHETLSGNDFCSKGERREE